jgi:citronellol/citronellal dehydrogenase
VLGDHVSEHVDGSAVDPDQRRPPVEILGNQLPAELFESVEEIVEAVVALCDCPADVTGRVFFSLDLIDEWGLSVRGLNGLARV